MVSHGHGHPVTFQCLEKRTPVALASLSLRVLSILRVRVSAHRMWVRNTRSSRSTRRRSRQRAGGRSSCWRARRSSSERNEKDEVQACDSALVRSGGAAAGAAAARRASDERKKDVRPSAGGGGSSGEWRVAAVCALASHDFSCQRENSLHSRNSRAREVGGEKSGQIGLNKIM